MWLHAIWIYMNRTVDKSTYVYWISTLQSVLYIWICCSRHHRQLSLDVGCCIANFGTYADSSLSEPHQLATLSVCLPWCVLQVARKLVAFCTLLLFCSLLFNVASFAECSYGDVSLASATFSCCRCLLLCSRLILHCPDFKGTDIVEWHYMPGCQW